MFLVRDVFQVKFDQMDKVMAFLKAAQEADAAGDSGISRVLTDVSGDMFTLVFETKTESIDAHREAMLAAYADPERSEGMAALGQLMEHGRREYYNIEYEFGD
jgi:hypothetical protein